MYEFQPYDVLQVSYTTLKGPWLDFSTLRTPDDAAQAMRLVDSGRWDDKPALFRIMRSEPRNANGLVVYGPTRAPRRQAAKEHKCNGARMSYHTSCTCGWYSMDYDASTYPHPRSEAYKAWREHVAESHAKDTDPHKD